MNVSVKLVVVVGEGADKREFSVSSHAYADPLVGHDQGWMIPGPKDRDVPIAATAQKLAVELAEHVADLLLASETGNGAGRAEWAESGGPERVR